MVVEELVVAVVLELRNCYYSGGGNKRNAVLTDGPGGDRVNNETMKLLL